MTFLQIPSKLLENIDILKNFNQGYSFLQIKVKFFISML